ncbi:MAG TPA: hypothetical protein VNV41_08485 [Candidatus Acidoferrales bacterium]|nr:hypothetical protein [Candidatus Acidoferrales bacterium]
MDFYARRQPRLVVDSLLPENEIRTFAQRAEQAPADFCGLGEVRFVPHDLFGLLVYPRLAREPLDDALGRFFRPASGATGKIESNHVSAVQDDGPRICECFRAQEIRDFRILFFLPLCFFLRSFTSSPCFVFDLSNSLVTAGVERPNDWYLAYYFLTRNYSGGVFIVFAVD